MNDKISIITVSLNCKNDIEETILSVICQTYSNIEYIVIDGNSADGTQEIIKKYKKNIHFTISEDDNGIFDAMNKGLKYATGKWINFMNAGDTFYDLQILEKIFGKSDFKSTGVIYGSTYSHGSIRTPSNLSSLKYGGIMACHQSIFYNSEICNNELYYKTKHQHYGDIELTRRLYIKKIPFSKISIIIANYKGGGFSSAASTKARKAKFDYLYQNYGHKGILYGIVGKIKYIITRYTGYYILPAIIYNSHAII